VCKPTPKLDTLSKGKSVKSRLDVEVIVRKDRFKLEGGELFKGVFRKLFKPRMNLFQKPIDSVIQLAKTASKIVKLEKTIGSFFKIIGCLYQQTTNKLKLKS